MSAGVGRCWLLRLLYVAAVPQLPAARPRSRDAPRRHRLTPVLGAGASCVQAAARKTYAVIGAVTGPGPRRAVISSMTLARTAGPSPRSSTAARTGVPVR